MSLRKASAAPAVVQSPMDPSGSPQAMRTPGSDQADSPLTGDLDSEEFRRAGHAAIDWIADYLAHPERHRVLPDVEPGALLAKLPEAPPGEPTSPAELLADFERDILPHVTHWNHPGFMAYFAAGGSAPGVLAEILSGALNNVGLLWRSSPALAELEEATLRWLAAALGLPATWFGMFHDTASTASLHAVIAARERAAAAARADGRSLDLNRLVFYASDQAHSSLEKAAAALGVGFGACRKIASDQAFRMRPDALRAAIDADVRRGYAPIAVVATVGTTPSAAVDPVGPLAEIAAERCLWLHVDAAYAGAAALLPEKRNHFAGCERADSFVVNPHKWLFVPMDCSAFYTADPEALRRAFALTPEFLRSREHVRAVNYMEYGVPLGRRFRALKLWYVLRAFGVERIAATVREHIRCAGLLAGWVDESADFERLAPTDFSLVCLSYRPPGASAAEADAASQRLLEAVNASGEFHLTHAKLGGRYAIRVAIGQIRTAERHVRRLWDLLRELAPQAAAGR